MLRTSKPYRMEYTISIHKMKRLSISYPQWELFQFHNNLWNSKIKLSMLPVYSWHSFSNYSLMDLSTILTHSHPYLPSITLTLIGLNNSWKLIMSKCIDPLLQDTILNTVIAWWLFGKIDQIEHSHHILSIW